MKRSLYALALACVALAASAVSHVVDAAVSAYRFTKDCLATGFKLLAGEAADLNPVSIRITQAKAFVQRIMKRERPTVTPGWRMCPSI
jgi:hypothetical protein